MVSIRATSLLKFLEESLNSHKCCLIDLVMQQRRVFQLMLQMLRLAEVARKIMQNLYEIESPITDV